MKTFLGVIFLAAIAYALYQGGPPSSAPDAAVRNADEAWAKAVASTSVAQTLAFYDPAAVTAGSAMFPARGLADFRANWAKLFARPNFALTWKAERVVITESGSIAYSSGTWSDGPNRNGPYLAVWRKQANGQWKVIIDAAWLVRQASGVMQACRKLTGIGKAGIARRLQIGRTSVRRILG